MKRISITNWEIDLFNYLHENKVATVDQIFRDLPKYKTRKSLIWRLWKLKKLGYLTGQYNTDHNGLNVYNLTKKTFRRFISKDRFVRMELKSNSVLHDIELVDIRHKIMNMIKVNEYYTENFHQAWEYINFDFGTPIPDTIIDVNKKDGKYIFGIEYEASAKSKKRYEDIIRSYYNEEKIHFVIYICKTESLLKKIQKIEHKLYPTKYKRLFYVTLDEFYSNKDFIIKNSHGFTVNLNENISSNSPQNETPI
ncbi:MAG: hypothetical protein N4A33_04330 [Bacteriovoracaceae bacterium]|jgi:hypothetical protein|nr:hypothetical protein [Bacteriovoracaceae bacterium]